MAASLMWENACPDLTARGNMYLTGRFCGLERRAREVHIKELLKALGLADRGDDHLRRFSKGMRPA